MSGASLLISLCLPRSGEEHPSGPNAWTGGSKGIDAEELLAEAARLGAFLPVFQNLKSLGLVEESPGMAEWHKRFRNICARNLALEREGRRLLEMLDRAGVTCRLIKGVQLTNLLYPDLSWREVSDVDFVVAGAELADAYQCLKHNGLQDAGNRWNPKALERAAREPSYTFPQAVLAEIHRAADRQRASPR
ncbi:MAG: nucleotidyltransferase family protein [Acidobacteriota bacterium]